MANHITATPETNAAARSHLDGITDPWERYLAATAAQEWHDDVSDALQRERDKALAECNRQRGEAPKLSYEVLAERTGLTRSGVQKAVERGRATE